MRRCRLGRLAADRHGGVSAGGVARVKSACFYLLLLAATPVHAGELFGGAYVHDVKLPTDESGLEDGADLMLGLRGGKIFGTPLQPYVFGAVNTAGETS